MNSERAQAYGRVMKTLAGLSASKFHPAEQDVVREAADALFFCEDLGADEHAARALDAVRTLLEGMAEADRLAPETAGRLLADIEDCGPLTRVG